MNIKFNDLLVITLLVSTQALGMANQTELKSLIEESAENCRWAIKDFNFQQFNTNFEILKKYKSYVSVMIILFRYWK